MAVRHFATKASAYYQPDHNKKKIKVSEGQKKVKVSEGQYKRRPVQSPWHKPSSNQQEADDDEMAEARMLPMSLSADTEKKKAKGRAAIRKAIESNAQLRGINPDLVERALDPMLLSVYTTYGVHVVYYRPPGGKWYFWTNNLGSFSMTLITGGLILMERSMIEPWMSFPIAAVVLALWFFPYLRLKTLATRLVYDVRGRRISFRGHNFWGLQGLQGDVFSLSRIRLVWTTRKYIKFKVRANSVFDPFGWVTWRIPRFENILKQERNHRDFTKHMWAGAGGGATPMRHPFPVVASDFPLDQEGLSKTGFDFGFYQGTDEEYAALGYKTPNVVKNHFISSNVTLEATQPSLFSRLLRRVMRRFSRMMRGPKNPYTSARHPGAIGQASQQMFKRKKSDHESAYAMNADGTTSFKGVRLCTMGVALNREEEMKIVDVLKSEMSEDDLRKSDDRRRLWHNYTPKEMFLAVLRVLTKS